MKYRNPLKQILTQGRSYWDQPHSRSAVRKAFLKALQCRTSELGAEVYLSEDQELILYHPCKSRACPSCGYRAMIQWLRERWAALPENIYKGITLTMPDLLWPLFQANLHLARALPALAATVIQTRVTARYGVRVGVIAILHTFNGQMNFNSHVHTMITGGGLVHSAWLSYVYYDPFQIRRAWREAVIDLLRTALRAGRLRTTMSRDEVETMLDEQERRPWRIKIQSFNERGHFLQYAGRYVRRPPIAQRRITELGKQTVKFWYKDKKLRRRVEAECSLEEFLDRWAQHIPDHYQHGVRNFGLFAPRSLGQTCAAVFVMLGQPRRARPKPRRWADSIKRDFGYDPLLDRKGNRMKWARRLKPKGTA
jgi:hypothetical protein